MPDAYEKLPIAVVTGFLGSGKTTLIRSLLTKPRMAFTAVVVNELGEVGIDHELLATSSDCVRLLPSGCLCCAVRTDLQQTLTELFLKRQAGEVMPFRRVLLETSGMADPVPVMHSLLKDAVLAEHYRLDCIAATVSALDGDAQIDEFEEASKQVAIADRIVMTKRDLVDEVRERAVRACIARINPYAEVTASVHGDLDPQVLCDVSPRGGGLDRRASLHRWLPQEGTPPGVERYLGERVSGKRHRGIVSFVLGFDAPLSWGAFANAMQLLVNLRGPDLLRVKGLLSVAGERGPMVVQGAQHVFHPPLQLDDWPGPNHRSRLVFITRGIPRELVAPLFRSVARLDRSAANDHPTTLSA